MVDKLSVLRECYRVLKPGGRMAGYTIHTPANATDAQKLRSTELGPSQVAAADGPPQLAQSAGFRIVDFVDVTADFRATSAAFLRARNELEAELRADEGDDVFEHECAMEENTLIGIDEGLLFRCLLIVEKV